MRIRWLILAGFLAMTFPLPAGAEEHPALSLDQLSKQYKTPEAVAQFLRQEFLFESDLDLFGEAEHWQLPEEFAARRKGDCEDYALLAQAALIRNGIEAYLFSIFGENGYAHTVCAFVDPRGGYSVIDQGKIRYYRAKTFEKLAYQLYPAWKFGGLSEQVGTRGRLIKRFTNPHPVHFSAFADPLGSFQF